MRADIHGYLSEVKNHLHLDAGTETRVISELETHFQDKVSDLRDQGFDDREAADEAIASFGQARDVARLMYEAYSRGTWTEAFVSLQPHILVASLFATHLWRHPLVLAVTFAVIAAIALLGWRGGTPIWTYSFAGYAFFPPLVFAYVCRGLPGEALASVASGVGTLRAIAALAALVALYGGAVAMLVASVVRVSRRDWILVSLMLLPLAVLGLWAYTVEQTGDFLVVSIGADALKHGLWDRSMAWLCTVLGITAAAFVRMRARLVKGVAVVLIGIIAGALVVWSLRGAMGFGGLLAVCLGLFLLLMSPLVIHTLLDRGAVRPRDAQEVHAS